MIKTVAIGRSYSTFELGIINSVALKEFDVKCYMTVDMVFTIEFLRSKFCVFPCAEPRCTTRRPMDICRALSRCLRQGRL